VNLFTKKKEVGKPGDFDHMGDEELTRFIEAQGEVVRELERQLQLLTPPAPKQRKAACHSPASAIDHFTIAQMGAGHARSIRMVLHAPVMAKLRANKTRQKWSGTERQLVRETRDQTTSLIWAPKSVRI
jgi:hypothetical protein